VETIATADGASADRIVLADAVYWTTTGAPSVIRRTPLAGSGPTETLATTTSAVESIAYGAGELYVATADGTIAAYPGPRVVRTGEPHPTSLVFAGATLLWADLDTGEVVRSALDGSARAVLASPGALPQGGKAEQVAYQRGDVFIRTRTSEALSFIAITDLDGKPPGIVTSSFSISTFAVDPLARRLLHANRDVIRNNDALGFVAAAEDLSRSNLPSDLVLGQYLVDSASVAEDGVPYWITRPRPGDATKGALRRRRF
jgi:dipeptidyl aminopeptidase/acylaminoacyl peptidase